MIRYSDWRPTQFDTRGLGLDDRQDWFVAPVIRTRDSGCLEESNFHSALEEFGGESDTVEVHRFGHWANGWFEIILCHPSLEQQVQDLEQDLNEYPVINEDDFSARECEQAEQSWQNLNLRDRIRACVKFHVSIFAARRNAVPDAPCGGIYSYLAE